MTGLKKNTMRTTLAVTILVFLSKAGGFIREMIPAAYFGTTMKNELAKKRAVLRCAV